MPSQGLKVPAEPLAGWILSFCSRDAAWYREQLSGMFLATTVNLSVTGLPWTAKMPPRWAASLRVTWLDFKVSGPPCPGRSG
jgi:hypothetical protein